MYNYQSKLMKNTIYALLGALLIFSSCDNKEQEQKVEFDTLFQQVMKIHDDVMPETNNLYKLKKFAQDNIDVIPDTSIYIKPLRDVQLNAEKADEVMMQWMEKFSVPEASHKEKMQYLQNQLVEIDEVRKVMLSTLYDGKLVIRKTDKYIKENKLRNVGKTEFSAK